MDGWFENMVRMEQMLVIFFTGLKIGLTTQKQNTTSNPALFLFLSWA